MELSKNKEKYIRSLQLKKYRQKYNKFVVEGHKIVTEILNQGFSYEWLVATPDWLAENASGYAAAKTLVATPQQLGQLTSLTRATAVMAVVDIPSFSEVLQPGWTLYLDNIQDPGNAGTMLRLADWFGVGQVIFSPHSVDPFNAKVIQSSMGSLLRVGMGRMHFLALRQKLPQAVVYAADMEGESVFSVEEARTPGILIVGSEGQGLSVEHQPLVDRYISIPKAAGSQAESLNAAMACGIILASLTQFG
ncbi:MAG: RNA methyltransferase [Saprospiraceae bacterium]|nr:RNA methyltransferase [Saprospiraceae bacterium]